MRVGRSPIRKIGANDRFVMPPSNMSKPLIQHQKLFRMLLLAKDYFSLMMVTMKQMIYKKLLKKMVRMLQLQPILGIEPYTKLFEEVKEAYLELA